MKQFSVFLPFGLVVVLGSCNVTRTMERRSDAAFVKNGLQQRTFTDASGPHFTWATAAPTAGKAKLLLVHGITSSSAMWAGNLGALSKDYDLIAPDLIGHGRSTSTWSGNSVDAQVAHLVVVLDSLHITEPVYVVGNSYGGAIAANLAEQHPERVRTLVIYDGPASDYTAAMADSVARSVGAADITDLFTPKNADEQYRLLSMSMYKAPKIPRFALKQLHAKLESKRKDHLALLKDLLDREAMYATKTYDWRMPVYVLWGEQDRLIPLHTGRGIAKRNGLAADHLIVIPNSGHVSSIEQKDVFEAHIKRILQVSPCPDPALREANKDIMCTMQYDPVCGCDGKTYPNPCAAGREGVRVTGTGECK